MSFCDRVIGAFVLGVSQIIVTELLLGALFQKLFAMPLFAANVIMSSGVLILSFTPYRKGGAQSTSSKISLALKELRGVAADFWTLLKNDFFLACIFCLTVISICWMIFLGYLFPSYTWDALWYHLPIVGYIMQDGAIRDIANHSFINQWINMFPKNIELLFLWNIIFLDSDIIVDLTQLTFTIIGIVSVYSIAMKLGIQRNYALYASLLFFFTPIMVLQSTTNYVDVAIAVLFIIAVNFIIRNYRKSQSGNRAEGGVKEQRVYALCLAGLATGILLGSKSSGPLFVGILSLVIMIQELTARAGSLKAVTMNQNSVLTKSLKLYVLYFLVPLLLLGSYWYMKNWIVNSNPVYPMQISVFGTTIFKGLYKGIVEPPPEIINRLSYVTRPLYVWLENIQYYLYDSRLGGLGPIWFILFLPGILFSILYSLAKKKYDFLLVSAIFIFTFLLYPRNWTPRYVIFIVGFGALSFAFAVNTFGDRKNIIKTLALLLAVYAFIITNSPCITPHQIKKFIELPPGERTVAMQQPFNIDLHVRQEYGYWIWISNHVSKGDTLAYTFEPLFFSPLWNSSFSSRIAYLKGKSYNDWLDGLRKSDASYVLIRTNSQEDKWIKFSHSMSWLGAKERFNVVYADPNYTIAKFERAEG
ncbi:MAG: hypothetical protein AMK71_00145 [Nitrospira bacterium SG8_35_4]|nr:MAG: hypothetical protein AMK71_00145 [Nitrospira bacterium SG8_35_4]